MSFYYLLDDLFEDGCLEPALSEQFLATRKDLLVEETVFLDGVGNRHRKAAKHQRVEPLHEERWWINAQDIGGYDPPSTAGACDHIEVVARTRFRVEIYPDNPLMPPPSGCKVKFLKRI
jgi:hypothetical protein